jgi:hypothetical protein
MILNNTCDLPDDRLNFVTAAPVVDFNNYLEFERERRFRDKTHTEDPEKQRIENSLQEFGRVLRNNDKTEILYLPPFQSLPMVPSCCSTWYARFQQNCTTMH